jgi:hypothetical protein
MSWHVFALVCTFSFCSYYAGILIRFYGLPGPNPLPLRRQLLLGIPISVGVITPLLTILGTALSDSNPNPVSVLGVLGIIMEHGLVLNETFAQRLQKLLQDSSP